MVLPTQHFAQGSCWARCFGATRMIARDGLLQITQVLASFCSRRCCRASSCSSRSGSSGPGPRVFQPYRDLWKLFHKQMVVPETASWLYWAAPVVAFTAMLTVPILIPGADQLPAAAFRHGRHPGRRPDPDAGLVHDHARGPRHASAYGGMGSSRAVMVTILAEPTLILVFVGITLLAKAMLPFVVNHLLVAEPPSTGARRICSWSPRSSSCFWRRPTGYRSIPARTSRST